MGKNSPSMTTTGVQIVDKNGKNKKWFPVSVCCATCLCHFWPKKKSNKFYYEFNNDKKQFVLMKRKNRKNNKYIGDGNITQYLENPSNNQSEVEESIRNNSKLYLTFLSYDNINSICKLSK